MFKNTKLFLKYSNFYTNRKDPVPFILFLLVITIPVIQLSISIAALFSFYVLVVFALDQAFMKERFVRVDNNFNIILKQRNEIMILNYKINNFK